MYLTLLLPPVMKERRFGSRGSGIDLNPEDLYGSAIT